MKEAKSIALSSGMVVNKGDMFEALKRSGSIQEGDIITIEAILPGKRRNKDRICINTGPYALSIEEFEDIFGDYPSKRDDPWEYGINLAGRYDTRSYKRSGILHLPPTDVAKIRRQVLIQEGKEILENNAIDSGRFTNAQLYGVAIETKRKLEKAYKEAGLKVSMNLLQKKGDRL